MGGTPSHHPFDFRIFHYEPAIFGYPHSRNPHIIYIIYIYIYLFTYINTQMYIVVDKKYMYIHIYICTYV